MVAGMKITHILIATFIALAPAGSFAANPLPPKAAVVNKLPLSEVGTGTYRKIGFSIYDATLWAPLGEYAEAKPFALQLTYKRSLSKSTVVDSVMDSIAEQNVADEAKLAEWKATLEPLLFGVKDGDVFVGVSVPKKGADIYFNGGYVTTIKDPALVKAFFAIWLGDTASPELRAALLKPSQPQIARQ